RPRWVRPAAGVVAALVLAWLAVRAGGTPDPEPRPVAVPTTTPVPPPPSPTPPRPEPVFRLDGEPGPGPDVRLLVGSGRPGVLDARTGRLTPLPGLRAARDAHILLSRGRGFTAALVFDGTERFARGSLLPDGGGSVDLGRLVDLLAMRDGTVLTLVCVAGTGGGCVLGNRTATGTIRWQRRVPGALGLIRDTPYGVLLAGDGGDRGADLRLEDPRTGQVHRTISRSSHVLTADDRRVVYERAGCDYGCPLVVADLADGRQTSLPVRPGRPAAAALSPDGRRLALGYQGLHQQDPAPSPLREGRAVLVDLVTGREQPVPGLATGAKAVPVPLWTPDGSRLLLAAADGAGTGRLAAWRPGASRLTVLPVRLRGFGAGPGLVALLT
ncbi:MAG TPA: hypothetical protein VE547_03300, partial [Mycobacteriales bacterium]|nr:hypothetical protein [Mycobacteriales bacterium]